MIKFLRKRIKFDSFKKKIVKINFYTEKIIFVINFTCLMKHTL